MHSERLIALKLKMDALVGTPELHGAELLPDERRVIEEAISNFRAAGPSLLEQATPYLWQYYREVAQAFDAIQHADYGIPSLDSSQDIWQEVAIATTPEIRIGGRNLEPGVSYISFEGEVSWEPEHGLQLVFDHGLRVCKVGPYDGHTTNAHAYGDVALIGVIYASIR